jgi:hypothetical protein
MNIENFIPLHTLVSHYKVELSFFSHLSELGLVDVKTVEQIEYIHQDSIYEIEKMIRMHQELDVNIEGIDVVFNLLQKIDTLQKELVAARNRLRLYEN